MISKCKVCEKDIPPPQYGRDYLCIHCHKYSIVYDYYDGNLQSETISAENYFLTFFPAYKEANVVENGDEHHRIVNTFKMDELTHEAAIKWVDKLKTYVLFS